MRRILGVLLVPLFAGLLGLAAPAHADPLPLPTSPFGEPTGANDWTCAPTAGRPTPVVIVHGTGGDRKSLLDDLSAAMVDDGYCVFSLDYGKRGTQKIADSAVEVSHFIDQVLAKTGASRVSIVGHSQGGMMPRQIIKFLGGATKIDDLVAIAPSNHGSPKGAMSTYSAQYGDSPAAADQDAGSPFLTQLNAGDETPQPSSGPRISYTNIATKNDEIVTPTPTSQFLAGSPDEVTNILLQDKCPADQFEHILLTDDPVVLQWVENALATSGPADPSFTPLCG
jgi:triacylglycerol lipase